MEVISDSSDDVLSKVTVVLLNNVSLSESNSSSLVILSLNLNLFYLM